MNFRLGFVLGALLATAALPAAAARPMTLDDLLTAVRVDDPRLSPDGKWVAFVRTETDPATLKRNADIWLVPSDGTAPPRPMARSEKSDTTPCFSPDGTAIAFLSTRSGTSQVWVMSLLGGEARKVTDVPGGANGPLVFSKDGKRVAFVADVYPGCADEACNRKKLDEAEKGPVKAYHLTRLMSRHWDSWRPERRHHVLVADLETGKTTDVTPGDVDSPPHNEEGGGIAFSPDGKRIAVVSNRDGIDTEAWTTNKDVFLVPLAGGAAEKLTRNAAADVDPAFTPDGATVVTRSQRRAGFVWSERRKTSAGDVKVVSANTRKPFPAERDPMAPPLFSSFGVPPARGTS